MVKGAELNKEWDAFIHHSDDHAFFTIYKHYYHYMSYVGLKRNFKINKVQDAINDVFLYLWEQRTELVHVQHFHNYIITSFIRKLYRKEKFSIDEAIDLMDKTEFLISPSLEELHIQKQAKVSRINILKEHIDKLAPKQRSLIYQKFYLGLSYQEIANVNSISINTAYGTIYKAVDKLRNSMSKEEIAILSMFISSLLLLFLFFLKK